MPDHLTCSTNFWRCLRFQICQSSKYGRAVYVRVTQSSEYDWIWLICLNMAQYALVHLIVPEHGWILLNAAEHAWINCSDYARVLHVSHHLRNLIRFWIYIKLYIYIYIYIYIILYIYIYNFIYKYIKYNYFNVYWMYTK